MPNSNQLQLPDSSLSKVQKKEILCANVLKTQAQTWIFKIQMFREIFQKFGSMIGSVPDIIQARRLMVGSISTRENLHTSESVIENTQLQEIKIELELVKNVPYCFPQEERIYMQGWMGIIQQYFAFSIAQCKP